jgi:hypothetical protein
MPKLPLPPRSRPIFAPTRKAMTATEVKEAADRAEKPPKAKVNAKATKAAVDRADKSAKPKHRLVKAAEDAVAFAKGDKTKGRVVAREAMGVFGVRLPSAMADKLRKLAKARKVAPAVIVREALEKVL